MGKKRCEGWQQFQLQQCQQRQSRLLCVQTSDTHLAACYCSINDENIDAVASKQELSVERRAATIDVQVSQSTD